MKEIILSFLTVPGLLILLYFFGLVSYGYKKKLKIFSSCLFIMFVISLPFFGKILSYPLHGLPKLFISSDLKDVKSAVVLTGGIYRNVMNEWQPSKSTEERILYAKKLLNENNVAVSPGICFGKHGDDFVRFSLIENEQRTKQAVRSLKTII